MKYIINPMHRRFDGLEFPNIAKVKFNFVRNFRHLSLELMTHVVLLFLVTGKHTNFFNIRIQKTINNSIAERTGAAGD